VIDRTRITPWAGFAVPKGEVCPQPATIGTKLRHLGPNAASVTVAALGGGQGGRQAFAVDRREVPT
jgi:hypothetical protein